MKAVAMKMSGMQQEVDMQQGSVCVYIPRPGEKEADICMPGGAAENKIVTAGISA